MHFLTSKYSNELALKTKEIIKTTLKENLVKNPEIAPISQRLIDLGIKHYRQYQVDKHNIVFYKIDEVNNKVILLAVMDSRQSIRQLLSDVNLLS